MHRIILKAKKGQVVDHKDHNGLNNQKYNIRICTNSQNLQNKRKRKNTLSKYKGLHPSSNNKKWIACICVKSKMKYLGSFNTQKQAAIAYDIAALRYYKEYALLNFPELYK